MRITKITAYVVKSPAFYDIGGASKVGQTLPGSEYFRFDAYPQLYSRRSEALIVKVDTAEGISGWGETQAPIGPEVAQSVVQHIVGPSVLGRSALDTNLRFSEMYETMRVRGHGTGFQLDAIAGIDTALWDIRGKAANMSVSRLLGGRYRETLPCYASGCDASVLPPLSFPADHYEHDKAREWWYYTGHLRTAKGREYRNHYHFVFKLRDGKIRAVKEYVDTQYAHQVLFS